MRPGAVSGGGAGSPVRAARAGRLPAAAARSETRRAGRGAGPLSPALCRLPGPPPPGPGPRPGPGPGQRRDRGDPDPRRREVRVRARTGRTGPAGPRGTGGQGGRSRAGHDTRREPEPESRVRVREDGPRAGVGDRDARPGRGPAWAPVSGARRACGDSAGQRHRGRRSPERVRVRVVPACAQGAGRRAVPGPGGCGVSPRPRPRVGRVAGLGGGRGWDQGQDEAARAGRRGCKVGVQRFMPWCRGGA